MDSYSGLECQCILMIRRQKVLRQTLPAPGTTSQSGGPRGLRGWPRIGSPPMALALTGSDHLLRDNYPVFSRHREVYLFAISQKVSDLHFFALYLLPSKLLPSHHLFLLGPYLPPPDD